MQSFGQAASVRDQLVDCRGHPMRISLFDPQYYDRLGRYPGVLIEVLPDSLLVECLKPLPNLIPDTNVTLELLSSHELLWCHTRLRGGRESGQTRMRLDLPTCLQTQQKRTSPRIDTDLPIHYFIANSTTPLHGVIIDISLGGAALKATEQMGVGEVVSLVFSLGSGFSFQEIRAEVVRVSGTRNGGFVFGLRFIGLTPEQQSHLATWVRSRGGREC